MRNREKYALVIVRRSVAERKIALAVATFEFFCARLRVAMVAFVAEMVSSRPGGRWGLFPSLGLEVATSGRCGEHLEDSDPNRGGHSIIRSISYGATSLVKRAVFATVAVGETDGRFQCTSGIVRE